LSACPSVCSGVSCAEARISIADLGQPLSEASEALSRARSFRRTGATAATVADGRIDCLIKRSARCSPGSVSTSSVTAWG
jgi:hypothetical protein